MERDLRFRCLELAQRAEDHPAYATALQQFGGQLGPPSTATVIARAKAYADFVHGDVVAKPPVRDRVKSRRRK